MADVTVKRLEEMDALFEGSWVRARASLGVSAFGMQVAYFPPDNTTYPEHDHTHDGQEEIYTALSGSATLIAGGEEFRLEPGVFARVGPGEKRKIVTGDQPVQILALGGMPGRAYEPPPFTEVGAPPPQGPA